MSQYLILDRLEFSITYRCVSHCKHCQIGPDERARARGGLPPELAERAVRELCAAYPIRSMMTFGGEPLLYPETVCAAHAAARDCGIPARQVITSLGTPRKEEDSRRVARMLAESGVNGVWISIDAFHQEYIPIEVVRQNVRALLDAGIQNLNWNISWVVSPNHDNPWNARTRQVQAALSDLPVRYEDDDPIRVTPMGYAVENLGAYLPARQPCPGGRCGDIPYTTPLDQITCVSVEPDASLSVCFGLNIGSMRERSAAEICQEYNPYRLPWLKTILEQGPQGLLAEAQRRGVAPDPRGYASACGMCVDLRKRMEREHAER